MADDRRLGWIRSAAAVVCVGLMLVGWLLIPFTSPVVSAGIAMIGVLLYLAIRLLVPANAVAPENEQRTSDKHDV